MLHLRHLSQEYLLVLEGHVLLGSSTDNVIWFQTPTFMLSLLAIALIEALAIVDHFRRKGTTSADSYLKVMLLAYDLGFSLSLWVSLGVLGYHMMFGDGADQFFRFRMLLAMNLTISFVIVSAMLFYGGFSAVVEEAKAMCRTLRVAWIALWNGWARIGMP